jgi:hypothetical protein
MNQSNHVEEKKLARALKIAFEAADIDDGAWSENGPTPLAFKLANDPLLSRGKRALLRVAFDLWSGTGNITVNELLASAHQLPTQATSALIGILNAFLHGAGSAGAAPGLDVFLASREQSTMVVHSAPPRPTGILDPPKETPSTPPPPAN